MSIELPKIKIALYEPEIPQNVGAIMRTCACLGVPIIIIEPCGFFITDREFRRAKMDYNPEYEILPSFKHFILKYLENRKILLTPHTTLSIRDFGLSNKFLDNDILVFGRESNGVEIEIASFMHILLNLPMVSRARSLNLATSVAITLAEIGL